MPFLVLLLVGALPRPKPVLVISPPAVTSLYTITLGMDREVGLCGIGAVSGDTTTILGWFVPPQIGDTDRVSFRCPSSTLAVFHNHPWTGPADYAGITSPSDLCAMSTADGYSLTQQDSTLNWGIVGVGRFDPKWTMFCWWTKDQVSIALFTPSDSTQRMRIYIEDQ